MNNHSMPLSIALILMMIFLSGCSKPMTANGYIEGKYTYISTSVSGVLKQLMVSKGEAVKKGQLLLQLEPEPENDIYAAALENLKQAVAARDAVAANLIFIEQNFKRYKILAEKNAINTVQLEQSKATYETSAAKLAEANANIRSISANLAEAKWRKDQKVMVAPLDGTIFDIYYTQGEYTVSQKPILSVLSPLNIKAIFYIKEADLGKIKLHHKANVQCDGCKTSYPARLIYISSTAEYTPPIIFSAETNAKLVFRVEAEFSPADAANLHPGQPIQVEFHNE